MQHIPPVHVAHGRRKLRYPRDHDVTVVAAPCLALATDVIVERAAGRILEEDAEGGMLPALHERPEEANYMRVAHRCTVAHLVGYKCCGYTGINDDQHNWEALRHSLQLGTHWLTSLTS